MLAGHSGSVFSVVTERQTVSGSAGDGACGTGRRGVRADAGRAQRLGVLRGGDGSGRSCPGARTTVKVWTGRRGCARPGTTAV